ncbi:MAG: cell division protein FtsQ/DivIB [Flavobacteriaceae bacterium]|jgi:cell division protein FtsQ
MPSKKHLFFVAAFLLIILVSSFAHIRNSKRLVQKITIEFQSEGAKFLNDTLVDKLLIQNKGELPWKTKDSLVLSMLETLLEDNLYVDNAEVYHFQQGVLGVSIQEKQAVVRVQGADQYYLDKNGEWFPISKNHTPKVPLFMGTLKEEQKDDLLSLIDHFESDSFLRNELASIDYRDNSYFIGLRSYEFEVEIGQLDQISEKLAKLKVFCAYHNNHSKDKKYSLINLKFKNQVVGS